MRAEFVDILYGDRELEVARTENIMNWPTSRRPREIDGTVGSQYCTAESKAGCLVFVQSRIWTSIVSRQPVFLRRI